MKKKLIIGTLVISALVGMVGCAQIQQVSKGDISVIKDTKDIVATDVVASKIQTYEGVIGYDWADENEIVLTRENPELEPLKIDTVKMRADMIAKNLYLYDLSSKVEKKISDEIKYQEGAISSPSNKYIFYKSEFEEKATGYIVDSQGNTKAKISDNAIDDYDMSEAQWINDESLIAPCHSIKGFVILNIDGTIEKIKDVENGLMGTNDPIHGLSITNPENYLDKIYYVTIHRGADDDNRLKVYDMSKKEKNELVEDDVQEFSLSPSKEHLLMLTSNTEKNANELIITDLEGKQREILAEGYIYGVKWSPDGTQIAFISNEEGREGLYVIDIATKKKSLISLGEYYMPVSWSPSGQKIMIHGKKPKNNGRQFDEVDVTNVITIK